METSGLTSGIDVDVLLAWAATNPAVTRLLWVLVLVVATLVVWALFFCCYARSRGSSPALERYLEGRCVSGGGERRRGG